MDDMTLMVHQPEFCRQLGDQVWEYLVKDLKQDSQFIALSRRYYATVADIQTCVRLYGQFAGAESALLAKHRRHLKEIERQIKVRTEDFSKAWIKKYGAARISIREIVQGLEEEDREKFVLRAATAMFLADFMEDCFVEMNAVIRKYLADAKYEPLSDFFELQKKVTAYTREIFDDEGLGYQDLFDEHAAGIKMTIYNKVNGFINANEERERKEADDRRQLSFDFKDY